MYYKCIIGDYFHKLEIGKAYYIEDGWLYNDDHTLKLYRIDDWQLQHMFRLESVIR